MKVISLKTADFRNLRDAQTFFCDGVNVIYGDNAQGKTNLLEAIWLFTGAKSFRGAKETDYCRFSAQNSRCTLSFYAGERQQTAVLQYGAQKEASLNGVSLASPAKLSGKFSAVVFSPAHLSLVTEGPNERRKFLDAMLCQIKPRYAAALAAYQKAVGQRCALLRDLKYNRDLESLCDVFEEAAASSGAYLVEQRRKYTAYLSPIVGEYYGGISQGKEELALRYQTTGGETWQKDALLAALKESRKEDLLTGNTSVGPHRDDLELLISGVSARAFGSQGQQRSAVIALKLGEAQTLKAFIGEEPVILLDDVMSELDTARKQYVLNRLSDRQVFITCCDRADLKNLHAGLTLRMKDGALSSLQVKSRRKASEKNEAKE